MSWYAAVPFGVLALTFIIRLPVAFSLFVASISYFLVSGEPISMAVNTLVNGMFNNYLILAAPLFIFTANVMNSGQVTEKVFAFANGLLGRFRGGTGHVNVFASLVFSGMTGSAIADASGLGLMEIEQMKKEGYDSGFACAITAASATIGPIFPPSIPFVIYAMLSGASISALFMGGMVPGVLLAIFLMTYNAWISKRRNYPFGLRMSRREFWKYTFSSIPALLTPVILLGGIYGGAITPTEAGAVAALYSIIISIFIYRSLSPRALWKILTDTAGTTASLGIMIGCAILFAQVVALEQIPQAVAEIILKYSSNQVVFLMVINIAFLILGMITDVSVIQLVFVPIVIPIVRELGIDLVHFGVVITFNMMIGLSTPPFGMLLFVVSGISKTPIGEVIKELVPMILVMIVLLLMLTYIPQLVLFLPNTFLR